MILQKHIKNVVLNLVFNYYKYGWIIHQFLPNSR